MNVNDILGMVEMYYDKKVNILRLKFDGIYIEIHNSSNTQNKTTHDNDRLNIIGDYDYVIETIKSLN